MRTGAFEPAEATLVPQHEENDGNLVFHLLILGNCFIENNNYT